MAIVLYNQPELYSLAYNDNAYVMKSTNYTPTQRYKIVVLPETTPVDPPISTHRVYPRQGIDVNGVVTNDRAFFDPSRILQSLISPNIAIPGSNNATVFECANMKKGYRLFLEEEDKNAQGVYVSGDMIITDVKTVWNGVRNKVDWLDFDYEDFDMKNGTSGIRFLTDAPLTRYVNTGQSAFLYYLSSDDDIDRIFVESFDADGVSIVSTHISTSLSSPFNRIACGPYDLLNSDTSNWNSSNPTAFFNGATSYTIHTNSGGANEIVTFNIDQQCSKFTPIRLHWLNRLGGFDAFNFNLKSTKETAVDRDSYKSQEHTFSGTSWDYTKSSRGWTDYSVQTEDSITVNTPYLTGDESEWMHDLFTSSVIYQEIDNELIGVNIKGKKITEQTSLNDKLMQYTFDLDYSLTDMRQRG